MFTPLISERKAGRSGILFVLLVLSFSALFDAQAQWSNDAALNMRISGLANNEQSPKIIWGRSGPLIAWIEYLPSPANWGRIRVQKLDGDGNSVWQQNGIVATPAAYLVYPHFDIIPCYNVDIIAEDFFVVFECSGIDVNGNSLLEPNEQFEVEKIFVQRISAAGQQVWPRPIPVSDLKSSLFMSERGIGAPQHFNDNTDGVILCFYASNYPEPAGVRNRDAECIIVQGIDNDGRRKFGDLGRKVWEAWDGRGITGTIYLDGINVVPADLPPRGGIIFSWIATSRNGEFVYLQKVNADGTTAWQNPISPTGGTSIDWGGVGHNVVLAEDRIGGAVVVWRGRPGGGGQPPPTLWAQRIESNGNVPWQRQQAQGLRVFGLGGLAAEDLEEGTLVDVLYWNGLITIVWAGIPQGEPVSTIILQTITENGVITNGPDGRRIGTRDKIAERSPRIVLKPGGDPADGCGVVTWLRRDRRIYAWAGWGPVPVTTVGAPWDLKYASLPLARGAGVLVTWPDIRKGQLKKDIYAQPIWNGGVLNRPF